MALLMLLGYFMCNALLARAVLQQPYITKTLSTPPPQIKIIGYIQLYLNLKPKIQLTRSSYKVTSFFDFKPSLQGFQSVAEYLYDLLADIDDPTYFQRLISPFGDAQVTPLSNDTCIKKFLNSPACSFCPYACQAKMKFGQYQLEIQYVYKVFHAIYKKFLTAIDHIDCHPLQQHNANATRIKRSDVYNLYEQYHTQTRELTPSEENFLDVFMKALYAINLSLHKNLSYMKRVGIFTWILGWGVFSNARSISKIKKNLHILQKQNKLQDQQIKQLASYLNLTMHWVNRHSEMLYEMDTKMFIINCTLRHIMWNFDAM